MAYFRGDHYFFDDGDHFHLWVHGQKYDAWRDWAETFRDPSAVAGVQVENAIMDRFVLMRVAELLAQGTATRLLAEMEPELAGPTNCGAFQLKGNGRVIREAFAALERVCREYRPEELDDDVTPPA